MTEQTKQRLAILQKLGEGTQGAVFKVQLPDGQLRALKWYNLQFGTEEQQQTIRQLVQRGPPPRSAGKRFVWPTDLVFSPDSKAFGYLMPLIDRNKYSELGEIQSRQRPQPRFRVMAEISHQLATSYKALHAAGFCYRDISKNNVMFDVTTGDVCICDNDNVGIAGNSHGQILGTMEFMAPEVVLGKSDPSVATDLHSLTVLLFYFWMWHHPFHGDLECNIRVWDIPAKKRIYGDAPVFIFHPTNKSNRPTDVSYGTVQKRWEACPDILRDLFIRAFTEGLVNPSRRVMEGEWERTFSQLCDSVAVCPNCRAENFISVGIAHGRCWYDGHSVPAPWRLALDLPARRHEVIVYDGSVLTHKALDLDEMPSPVGIVESHPTHKGVLGLKNVSGDIWHAHPPKESPIDIEPGKTITLKPGLRITILGRSAHVVIY